MQTQVVMCLGKFPWLAVLLVTFVSSAVDARQYPRAFNDVLESSPAVSMAESDCSFDEDVSYIFPLSYQDARAALSEALQKSMETLFPGSERLGREERSISTPLSYPTINGFDEEVGTCS